ncbi:hemicentin-1-like isoform X2 [Brachyhypopomus gauderio]|uniref:hemicentin-1-like isoform X2 n=1 Tax=Brachyhypopomus gauderio TaxID=698409 RepID=UPI004041DFD2
MCKGNLFRIFLWLSVYFCKNVAGTPGMVSISVVGHTGPVIEGVWYELRCDIQNVAPVHLLTVTWYKGSAVLSSESFNHTNPLMIKSTTHWIRPTLSDNGADYRCVAELRQDPAGSQSTTTVMSNRLILTVECNCPVVLQPPAVVVEYRDSVSVNCSYSQAHIGMAWEASQGPVDLTKDVQFITWSVPSLKHWDILPLCFININEQGPQDRRHLPVIIYKTPDSVSIGFMNHTGPVTEGRQYKLQCDIQIVAPIQRLTVKWYKGQTLLTETFFNNSTKTPVDQSATLQISPSRDDDGAEYWCEAELRLGPVGPQPPPTLKSDPLSVTVYYGPEVSNCPEVLWLYEGESLQDYCSVTGNPLPEPRWLRAGLTFDPTRPLSRIENGHKFTMYADADTQHQLTVFVMYGPEISCRNNITVPENEEFDPDCTVAGFPEPELMWLKEGDIVVFPQIMQRTDAGTYVLLASNNFTANHTLEIEVQYPPADIMELNDQSVTEGSWVFLKCFSSARPRPEYEWIYHPEPNVTTTIEDGMSGLIINDASGRNIGTYTCIARNLLGETRRSVRVDVEGVEAPCHIIMKPASVVLEYRDSVEVECVNESVSLNLHWEFLNHRVNKRNLLVNASQFKYWNERPSCTGHFLFHDNCTKYLDITLYKTPDSVSISFMNHTGPVTGDRQYKLQCDIQNVAPVQHLTVKWYKEQTLLTETFFNDSTKTPVNQSATLQISPSRDDDGAEYWCEAELRLGPAGPQPPPTLKSDPLSINVHRTPGMVSISVVGHTGPVIEGVWYELRCDIQNVAPVHLLTVTWYKGSTVLSSESFNHTNPLMIKSTTHWIRPTLSDNGADYRCVAELRQDPAGSQSTTTVTSNRLIRTVKCNCPVVLQPPAVVVEYGDSVSVNCSYSQAHIGMAWEASQGSVDLTKDVQFITWSVPSLVHWDILPLCYININEQGPQDRRHLPVIIYKTPDSVSIGFMNHTGPVMEGRQYKLQCDIQNVVPVQHLTVKWYKGQTLLTETFFNDSTKTPVNQSATLQISPSRDDDGAEYWCEAELRLGPVGPQPPPTLKSDPLRTTVHHMPVINKKKLPPVVPVFWGYPEVLVCEAKGHPPPIISWTSNRADGGNLTITEASVENGGVYNCTATNSVGTDFVSVRVVVKVAKCPVVLTPPVVLVEYGAAVSVDCSTSLAHRGMGWEASQGRVDTRDDVQLITWSVPSLVQWDIKPLCYVNLNKTGLQCQRSLTVHIYKTPDRVSISMPDQTGPVSEGKPYELQCDIQNVAPVQRLTVKWYKGHTLVAKTSISDSTETPVNQSTRFRIVPSRVDDGAQYRCEAELDLNWESTGTQRAPRLSSDVLGVAVHWKKS